MYWLINGLWSTYKQTERLAFWEDNFQFLKSVLFKLLYLQTIPTPLCTIINYNASACLDCNMLRTSVCTGERIHNKYLKCINVWVLESDKATHFSADGSGSARPGRGAVSMTSARCRISIQSEPSCLGVRSRKKPTVQPGGGRGGVERWIRSSLLFHGTQKNLFQLISRLTPFWVRLADKIVMPGCRGN